MVFDVAVLSVCASSEVAEAIRRVCGANRVKLVKDRGDIHGGEDSDVFVILSGLINRPGYWVEVYAKDSGSPLSSMDFSLMLARDLGCEVCTSTEHLDPSLYYSVGSNGRVDTVAIDPDALDDGPAWVERGRAHSPYR